jgi:hypothetical protein
MNPVIFSTRWTARVRDFFCVFCGLPVNVPAARTVIVTDSKGIPETLNVLVIVSVKPSAERKRPRRKAG